MKDIEEYYKIYGKKVYLYLRSMVHDENLAEELTQETFYQAMKTIDKYRGECKPSVWFCQIAKHVWYRYLDKNKKYEMVSIDALNTDIADPYDLSSEVVNRFCKLEFYKKLRKFDENMKEIVYLRISSDLSFAEIGEIVGKSQNCVRVTFYRAKKKLMEGD
ncbi:sigma-70 family RNA polymerase sigma factor [Clostridium sp. UBA1056]|uniref:RNA polymerase sigma factor n=1 Tax=unclassified Clostridium TaxID=2614128 RepID=UPI003217DF94